MSEWISVEDKIPSHNQCVLFCISDTKEDFKQPLFGNFIHSKEDKSSFFLANGIHYWPVFVTHWLPLPALPKEQPSNEEIKVSLKVVEKLIATTVGHNLGYLAHEASDEEVEEILHSNEFPNITAKQVLSLYTANDNRDLKKLIEEVDNA